MKRLSIFLITAVMIAALGCGTSTHRNHMVLYSYSHSYDAQNDETYLMFSENRFKDPHRASFNVFA